MKKAKEHFDLHQIVTDKIINSLENNKIPWSKPWYAPENQHMNFHTGRKYQGVNQLLLGMTEYTEPYWMTYRQVQQRGGVITKGSKSEQIVFWKILDVKEKKNGTLTGEIAHIPFLKYSNVFNATQIEDIKFPEVDKPKIKITPDEASIFLEELLLSMPDPPKLTHGGHRACYIPIKDTVNMPPRDSFKSATGYVDTMAHEFVHATGHEKRLNRNTTTAFGDLTYSREELVAEIGSSFLCSEAGIDREFDNQVAYIKSWMKSLKNDKGMITWAASKATKAVNHILKIQPQQQEEKSAA
jgi:antirestriction protein ArdC|tara:strand:- start:852 stop:1745 length:894 start_codon:yes stop_codon:yes gene_type:complete